MTVSLKVSPLFAGVTKPVKGNTYVYRLICAGTVIYVGQSKSLIERIYGHLLSGKDFDEIGYFECTSEEVNDKEAFEIVKYNPALNTNLPKNNIYINENQFKKEVMKAFLDVEVNNEIVFERPPTKRSCHRYLRRSDIEVVTLKINNKINGLEKP